MQSELFLQSEVCVCGGALLPLRGEEDKVIASKKNLHIHAFPCTECIVLYAQHHLHL